MLRSSLWSISSLHHQMFTLRLLSTPTTVMIYAMRCRHFLSFYFIYRPAKNLGICEAMKDSSCASSKNRGKKDAFVSCIWRSLQIGTAFARRSDIIGLQMLLRRLQTMNWDTAADWDQRSTGDQELLSSPVMWLQSVSWEVLSEGCSSSAQFMVCLQGVTTISWLFVFSVWEKKLNDFEIFVWPVSTHLVFAPVCLWFLCPNPCVPPSFW